VRRQLGTRDHGRTRLARVGITVLVSAVAAGVLASCQPTTVLGSSATGLASFGHHTCVRLSNATMLCAGSNTDGQLGIGIRGGSSMGLSVNTLTPVIMRGAFS